MTYQLLSPAELELADAAEYYLTQESAELAGDFLNEYSATIRRILRNPNTWPKISENHRRCLFNRFPYALAYTIQNEEIHIVSVINLYRDPNRWKQNL